MNKPTRLAMCLLVALLPLLAADFASAESVQKAVEAQLPRYRLQGTLLDAFSELQKIGDLTIRVDWPALDDAGVKPTTKVQLSGSKVRLRDVLDLLLAQVQKPGQPLGWFLAENKLYVTTQNRVLHRNLLVDQQRRRATAGNREPQRKRTPPQRGLLRGEVRFQDTPLEDVIATLRQATGLSFFVNWGALENVGITRRTPVNLRLRNPSASTVLDFVMRGLNADKGKFQSVYWVVDQGVIHIAPGEQLNQVMRTRVFDVGDLLHVVPEFSGPRVKSVYTPESSGGSQSGGSNAENDLFPLDDDEKDDQPEKMSPAEQKAYARDQLIAAVKNSVGQDMWYPEGRGTITISPNGRQLIITQSLLGWKLMRQAANR